MDSRSRQRRIARISAWILASGLTLLGVILTSVRTYTPWVDDGSGSFTSDGPVDIWPMGLALLCVGLVVLAALLLVTGYGRVHDDRAAEHEPAVLHRG